MKLELLQQKIDVTKLVEGNELDIETYKKKFDMWNYVIENKLDNTRTAAKLLNDITIYFYAFFKDTKGEPLKLYSYQDLIGNRALMYDFNPLNPERHILFRAANQIGKSGLLCMLAIYWLFNGRNETVVIVSNNLTNSQRVLREIRFMLNTSKSQGWKESLGDTDNTTMLSIEGTDKDIYYVNRIICAPSGEGLLGYPVTRLMLDELDFYENGRNFFWKIAYPRLNKTKGQVIVFSNPNPDINKSESILHELETGDLFKRKFHFGFLDCPGNTLEEYEVAKRNSPEHLFCSTHDGEYSDLSGSFFKDTEINDMLQKEWSNNLPAVDRQIYIGVDLGKMKDNTVITVGTIKEPESKFDKYKDLDIKYIEVMPLGTEYDKIADRLVEIKQYYEENYYGVAKIGFDATGQKTFGDFLKKIGINAFEVDFSKKETNKTLLYNDFKLMAEQRKLKIVHTEQTRKQLAGLVFKYTESKKLKTVENKTTEIHDDIPSSIAILIHISVRPSKIPVVATFVSMDKKEDKKEINPIDNYYRKVIMNDRENYYKSKQLFGGMR